MYCRILAVLENNTVFKNQGFKLKHKLQCLQENFCFLICDSAFDNFQKLFIDVKKHYVPEKKSNPVRHKTCIDNSIKNLAEKRNNFILKKIQFDIVPTLTYLVHKSFDHCVLPNCLTKEVIIPLFKKGDTKIAENYRPISTLPTIGND